MENRLREYIKTARERTEEYGKTSKRYFQINLTLASALITTLTFFISFFYNQENLKFRNYFFILIIGAVISLIIVFGNIIYEFSAKKTDFRGFNRTTLSFHKGNVPEDNKPEKLEGNLGVFIKNFENGKGNLLKNETSLIRNDIKELYVLHYYASNYQRIVIKTREILKWEVLIILSSIVLQLIYCLFLVFGLEAFLIIILCLIIGAYIILEPIVKITLEIFEKILNLLKTLFKRFGSRIIAKFNKINKQNLKK